MLQYHSEADEQGRRWIHCSQCSYRKFTHFPKERVHHLCDGHSSPGPGWHLRQILKEAGAMSDHKCRCKERALAMDDWGVDGCLENREIIIKWMKEAAFSRWFHQQVAIGWSLAGKPWFRPLDPFGSIVDEAIRRAAAPPHDKSHTSQER